MCVPAAGAGAQKMAGIPANPGLRQGSRSTPNRGLPPPIFLYTPNSIQLVPEEFLKRRNEPNEKFRRKKHSKKLFQDPSSESVTRTFRRGENSSESVLGHLG